MTKKFIISANNDDKEKTNLEAPRLDRFQRIEKLNDMLSRGWQIKGFEGAGKDQYFLLEKQG